MNTPIDPIKDVDSMNLPDDVREALKDARRDAASIIRSLDPLSITSLVDLREKLRSALERIERRVEFDRESR